MKLEHFYQAAALQKQALEPLCASFNDFLGRAGTYIHEAVKELALIQALRMAAVLNTITLPFMYVPEKEFTDMDMARLNKAASPTLYPGIDNICHFRQEVRFSLQLPPLWLVVHV